MAGKVAISGLSQANQKHEFAKNHGVKWPLDVCTMVIVCMYYGHCMYVLWSLYICTMVIVCMYYGHCMYVLWSLYVCTMVIVCIYYDHFRT